MKILQGFMDHDCEFLKKDNFLIIEDKINKFKVMFETGVELEVQFLGLKKHYLLYHGAFILKDECGFILDVDKCLGRDLIDLSTEMIKRINSSLKNKEIRLKK